MFQQGLKFGGVGVQQPKYHMESSYIIQSQFSQEKKRSIQELLKHPGNLENEIQVTQSFIGHIFLGTLSRDAFPGKQMIERMTH